MPIVLIVIGVMLFIAAYTDNVGYLGQQLAQDIKGWFLWAIAIGAIAAIGIIPKARPVAMALLVLVFAVLILQNRSAFTNLQQLQAIPPPSAPPSPADASSGASGILDQTGVLDNISAANTAGQSIGQSLDIVRLFGGG